MDLERFCHIVDAYGAEPERWPASERAAAEAFLARSYEATLFVKEAGKLDFLLDEMALGSPTEALKSRVLASAAEHLAPAGRRVADAAVTRRGGWRGWFSAIGRDIDAIDWRPAALGRPVTALAGICAVGFALGFAAPAVLDGMVLGDEELMAMTFASPLIEVDALIVEGDEG